MVMYVWTSMGSHEDKQKEQRIRDFRPFQINMDAIKKANMDVTMVCDQGENRMHTEKAVLVLTFY